MQPNLQALFWIVLGGITMSTLALVGGIMVFVKEETLQKLLALFV